jgi:hypothetical protein
MLEDRLSSALACFGLDAGAQLLEGLLTDALRDAALDVRADAGSVRCCLRATGEEAACEMSAQSARRAGFGHRRSEGASEK